MSIIDARQVTAGQLVSTDGYTYRRVRRVEDHRPGGFYSIGCTHIYYDDGPGHVFTIVLYGATVTTLDLHGIAA